jgi:hypothetical protein
VTLAFTSPSLDGEKVVISDEKGVFVASVPQGTYSLTMYYEDNKFERTNIVVKPGKIARVDAALDIQHGKNDPITITASPADKFRITGDVTLLGDDYYTVTLIEKGKKPVKLSYFDKLELVDGTVLATLTEAASGAVEVTAAGKVIATVTSDGRAKLPGKAKPIYFDAKGDLVNAARKLKINPAAIGKRVETMAVLVTLLRDRL